MIGRLQNKVALITGGGSWIGKEIPQFFAKEGAKVFIVGRDLKKIEITANEINQYGGQATYCQADIIRETEVKLAVNQAIEQYQTIDILVQNAAIYPSSTIDVMPYSQWQQVIDINLNGSFLVLKYVGEFGRIIFISSVAGEEIGKPGLAHYAASKAGLNGLMRTAALEFAKYNVTVNSIDPGNILNVERFGDKLEADELNKISSKIPLGRIGTPKDIASLALFLASSESGFITGQNLIIDGGETVT